MDGSKMSMKNRFASLPTSTVLLRFARCEREEGKFEEIAFQM
jgi:hypothetical protein